MKTWLLFVLLCLSTTAYGEIYRWRDSSGVTHFASSLDDVPAKYRARVKAMNYGPEPKGDSGTPASTSPVGMSTPMSMPTPQSVSASGETVQKAISGRQLRRDGRRASAEMRDE